MYRSLACLRAQRDLSEALKEAGIGERRTTELRPNRHSWISLEVQHPVTCSLVCLTKYTSPMRCYCRVLPSVRSDLDLAWKRCGCTLYLA